MRKILTLVIILSLFGCLTTNSQTVDRVALSDINVKYIQIFVQTKVFGSNVTIEVDFGQNGSRGSVNGSQITDLDGRVMEFNSAVDALNFFDQLGYEFLESNRSSLERVNVDQYLLRRKAEMDLANGRRGN